VHLYAWDEQDPILRAWSSAFPHTVLPKKDIPPQLMDHLRYPEDMFKVQRFQYARYHVTNPNTWFQNDQRWSVPDDPNAPGGKTLQPPYRMFVTQPPGLVPDNDNGSDTPYQNPIKAPPGPTWSMTSTFVPVKRSNLAAYVSVDSDANSPTYGQIRVINVIDQQLQGPGQVANAMQSDPGVADTLNDFNQSGSTPTYGNLLTVPIGDDLMYVEPVYASRTAQSAANYLSLKYVLVYYKGGVGIDDNLAGALADARQKSTANTSGPPSTPPSSPPSTPSSSPTGTPTGTPSTSPGSASGEELLHLAEHQFVLAQKAYDNGDLGGYQRHTDKAREYIQQALAKDNGSSPSSSPKPSGPSPSATP
jgi:uncharacterized protein